MLNYIGRFLIILNGLLISGNAIAHVAFFHYGIEKGLPETRITSVSQDSTGFIWLAGDNSLYRFDGDRYKTYRNVHSDNSQQNFGKINTLYTDSKGILWVGTSSGISYYESATDRFTSPVQGWKNLGVNDFDEDSEGFIWAATNSGLARINPHTGYTLWFTDSLTVKSPGKNVLPDGNITLLTCGNNGKIWYYTENGNLYLFNPGTLETEDYSVLEDTDLASANISKLEYRNGILHFSTLSRGFYLFNPLQGTLQNTVFDSMGYVIHHFRIANDTTIWLTSNNGLFRYNPETGNYLRYTEDPVDPMSMKRTANQFVYIDREDNLWISSGAGGIDYGLTNTPFHHFGTKGQEPYQLEQAEVTAIAFDNENNMWLGYQGAFAEKHHHTPLRKQRFQIKSRNVTGYSGSVFSIFIDSKGRTWLGGWETGLQKLNSRGNAFEFAPVVPGRIDSLIRTADIRCITEDKKGNLWISFHGIGLGKYNPETYRMELFRHQPQNPGNSLSNDWTYNLSIDNYNNLWIATSYGVSKLNLQNHTFENYYQEEENPFSLNNNNINTIYADPWGMVWAGTDDGINVYIPEQNAFVPVVDENKNAALAISALLSVKPGELWASTTSGIIFLDWTWNSTYDGLQGNIRFFNRMSGLISTSYLARSSAMDNEGTVYFGGLEGIDYFSPEVAAAYIHESTRPVITDLSLDGVPVLHDLLASDIRSLKLNHHHRMISVRFTAPSFNNPERKLYRYQMQGFDRQWNYTQYEQVANYTNLPPGEYTFIVETQDRYGNWNQQEASMSLIVTPPFWNTILFYVIVSASSVLLLLLIVYARSRMYMARQRELRMLIEERTKELILKNQELERINQTKNRLFSIISHDLKSPFSGILGLLELLADPSNGIESNKQQELLEMARNSAANTYELLENLLTWAHSQMKQTISHPKKQNISMLLRKNIDLKMPVAMQKKIKVESQFPEVLEANFDREMINAVIRNILNNAVKFTNPGGIIEVAAFRKNGEVMVRVADNGVGIEEEELTDLFKDGKKSRPGTMGEKGTGLGLVICKEFVEKNRGKIWASPNQPRGSVFEFSLPAN